MILYHGSFLEIAQPDLVHFRSNVDFGRGFYVTPLCEQAAKWCGKFKRRGKDGIISKYEYDESREVELKVLKFDAYSKEWLATVYKGNIIKNLIMDCQSYTKYRPNETTGGIFVSWRRKEELPTGA